MYYKGLPNFGAARDIPRGAVLHESLKRRLKEVGDYSPTNNHGDRDPEDVKKFKLSKEEEGDNQCLRPKKGGLPDLKQAKQTRFESTGLKIDGEKWDERHDLWQFNYPSTTSRTNGH